MNGAGKLKMANGDTYEGHFIEGKPHGQGKYKKNKDSKKKYDRNELHEFSYTGEWKNGKPDGQGKQFENGGSVYDGDFKEGTKDGQGS